MMPDYRVIWIIASMTLLAVTGIFHAWCDIIKAGIQ
jgi:hypothetical protein